MNVQRPKALRLLSTYKISTYLSDRRPPPTLPYERTLMPLVWQSCTIPLSGRLSRRENWTCDDQMTRAGSFEQDFLILGSWPAHSLWGCLVRVWGGHTLMRGSSFIIYYAFISQLVIHPPTWLQATVTPASHILATASTFWWREGDKFSAVN